MLSKNKEKLIKSLHAKKGREKSGLCLVEGEKVVELAKDFVDFEFKREDANGFYDLVTTDAPQDVAAVARIPEFTLSSVKVSKTIVVLDGVQDPGNVGAILRLCLAFDASLLLIESADVTSPKVIRSSVGAMFQVPWVKVKREEALELLASLNRKIYRLELNDESKPISTIASGDNIVLMVGSEGNGIMLDIEGESVKIDHSDKLESLNVGNSLAIALFERNK